MRKAMRNTIFGTALVAGLLATGAAANAQRPGFARDGFYGRGFEHPVVRGGFVRPVGPAYRVAPAYGFGVTVGAPVYAAPVDNAYIPPCPGDGYEWAAGYYNGGIWVPGAWRMRAGYHVGFVDHGYGHGFEHRGFYGGRR